MIKELEITNTKDKERYFSLYTVVYNQCLIVVTMCGLSVLLDQWL